MWKQYKKTIIITILLTLLPILFGVLTWDQLPDKMAVHFNLNNEANRYVGKSMAVFGLPFLLMLLQIFCLTVTGLDPKNNNISTKSMNVVLWLIPTLSWLVSTLTYSTALGYQVNIGAIVITFIGILFIILGNYTPKNKKNYSYGTRIPWALDNEDNWYHTNRVTGICIVIGGILLTICGLLMFFMTTNFWLIILELVIVLTITLYPILYSYLYYKKHQ